MSSTEAASAVKPPFAEEERRPLWWYAKLLRRLRPRGGRLLQVECGSGELLRLLVDHFEVFGFDIRPRERNQCRLNVPGALVIEDWESRPEVGFDVVVSIGCFGRRGARAQIRGLLPSLNPDGLLVLIVPNPHGWGARWKGRNWPPRRAADESLLREAEWKTLLREMGLELRGVRGDGVWDTPYLRYLPEPMQAAVCDATLAAATVLPVARGLFPTRAGESLILLIERPSRG